MNARPLEEHFSDPLELSPIVAMLVNEGQIQIFHFSVCEVTYLGLATLGFIGTSGRDRVLPSLLGLEGAVRIGRNLFLMSHQGFTALKKAARPGDPEIADRDNECHDEYGGPNQVPSRAH